MKVYGVYDTTRCEGCVGIFDTVNEVATYLCTTPQNVYYYLCKKMTYDSKYKIEKFVL